MNRTNITDARKGLIVVCTAAFLVPFMGSALNLALHEIGQQFTMKAVSLTWVTIAYLLSTAIFQVPFARIADIVGRKKIFMTGLMTLLVSSFLCGLSSSGAMLIAMRALSGVGSAMLFGTNIAILTSISSKESRGKAIGINTAIVYAALAVGPLLGGVLTRYLGWNSIFFVSSSIAALVLIFASIMLKGEWRESRGEKFDITGAILYGIGIAGLIYGFSTLPDTPAIICLIAGITTLLIFIYYEKRQLFPVFNVRLFSSNRTFAFSSMAALINYAATFAIVFMLSLYLQSVRGLNPGIAGLILISQAATQSIFSLIAGNLTGRIHPATLATLGMSIIVAGLAGFIFLTNSTPYWLLIILLILLGIGFGMFSSPNTNVIMSSVDKKYYSQASATTGTMRMTGQAFSMGIAGMAMSFYMGDSVIGPESNDQFMQSLRITFAIFLVLCIIGVYISRRRHAFSIQL